MPACRHNFLVSILSKASALAFESQPGVGHPHRLELALDGAVLAVGAVERHEADDLRARWQGPIVVARVEVDDIVAQSLRRARAMPAPERSETSRSAEAPPDIKSDAAAEDHSFSPRISTSVCRSMPRGGARALADQLDQREHVAGGGAAPVDDKIAVHLGNRGATDFRSFQSELVNQLPGRDFGGVFEDATGARHGWLRRPALLVELGGGLLHALAFGGFPSQNRAQGNVVLEQRAAAVLDIDLRRALFAHPPLVVHETNGFDDLEHPRAHRPGVHPQGSADAAGNPLEELEARQGAAAGLRRNGFQPGPGSAAQLGAHAFDSREGRMAERDDQAAHPAVPHQEIRAPARAS